MTIPLTFGVYEQASVGVGGTPSLWTHPRDERLAVDRLPFWKNLATTLEQSGVDLLFFGDVLGLYDIYGGDHKGAVEWAVEAPAYDPIVHVSALAALTERLTFGLTASTTYEHPFAFARRLSTIDELSEGRVGWNIVTSYLENAARNFGLSGQIPHDDRYDRADEFLEVVTGLWEGTWDDDAVIGSRELRRYADGAKVRTLDHVGERFRVAGPHLTPPTPQRTPYLFQAGWSERGRQFASRWAEGVFVGRGDADKTREGLDDVRARALAAGRVDADISALSAIRVVVGRTEIEAQEKLDDIQSNYHLEAQLVSYAGDTGIDLSQYADNEPLSNQSEGFRSNLVDQVPTAGEVRRKFERVTRGDESSLFIGTPAQIADQLEAHSAAAGLNGYLIAQFLSPDTVNDFVELVLPELRNRGVVPEKPRTGTLRSRLRQDGLDRLPTTHPGARLRGGVPAAV